MFENHKKAYIHSEEQLEKKLVKEFIDNGYEFFKADNLENLMSNLRVQLAKLNDIEGFEDEDWVKICKHLLKGNVFDKAKLLRDGFAIEIDGYRKTIFFLNQKDWCRNIFQVSNQINVEGKRKNRYDVTILINGFPMVQIELKRPGVDIKEAFNQCIRYKRDSMSGTIFEYVQIFIISNSNQTRYFANAKELGEGDFNKTIEFKDANNRSINELSEFRYEFLEKCQLSKLITKYTIIQDVVDEKAIILMRPYQVHAVEKIWNLIDAGVENGYVWHTTGSGKTLTSFKAAQLISERDDIDKVIFVVDRTDLDSQTTKEYKKFGSFITEDIVKEYRSTKELLKDIDNKAQKLMVTTIQKLDNAVDKLNKEDATNKRIVLIFDECHRSQKGKRHKNIEDFFSKVQKIGFTGTPIFAENAGNEYITTEEIFGKPIHKYILPNAVKDNKVLGFSVEYHTPFKIKENIEDKEVSNIDLKELYESEENIRNVCEFIIKNIDKNTYHREFNSMLCVSGVKNAIRYYKMFQTLEHDLKIASIFTWQPNGEQTTQESDQDGLEYVINDYNKKYKEKHSIDNFNHYRVDLMEKVKAKTIDLVIVSDMLLTGFDAELLNTLYVDKNLKYHGLIQAFSRTNRISKNNKKTYGNIVCFRPLKNRVDEAVRLFSDNNPDAFVLKEPFENYLNRVLNAWDNLVTNFPVADDINNLYDPEDEKKFIEIFKNLNRNKLALESFSEFEASKLPFTNGDFIKYKDVYIALFNKVDRNKDKESILRDIDFEIELVTIDRINYEYIIKLLKQIKHDNSITFEEIQEKLDHMDMMASKRELIYSFINHYLEQKDILYDSDVEIEDVLENYLQEHKTKKIKEIIKNENLKEEEFSKYAEDCEWDKSRLKVQEISHYFIDQPSFFSLEITKERIISNLKSLFNDIKF